MAELTLIVGISYQATRFTLDVSSIMSLLLTLKTGCEIHDSTRNLHKRQTFSQFARKRF